MIGASFCSGIGAPEVAAPWVDWRAAFDIDDFAQAVFRERHPSSVMGGDFTGLTAADWRARGLPWPRLIVAGTPCQAFSVAGSRLSLADDRGNVTLHFARLVHDLADAARADGAPAPCVLWENVPGVLNTPDNAFGCFLAALLGADRPLVAACAPALGDLFGDMGGDDAPFPEPSGWPGVGLAAGPRGRLGWRVLDARHFGVAQRRRRVFLVLDLGDGPDPAGVLFEPASLRGHPAAGRGARQEPAAGAAGGAGSGGCFGGGA